MINRFQKFMAGRYGIDQLSVALIICMFACSTLSVVTHVRIFSLLGYIPFGLALYRGLSRDLRKRGMENYRFAMFYSPLYRRMKRVETAVSNRIRYKYIRCSSCKALHRLPRGKGRVRITCRQCGSKFEAKS